MSVGRICIREVVVTDAPETVRTAPARMGEKRVGCLVVLDDGRRPFGMLTDCDLALRVVAEGRDAARTVVNDVMNPSPRAVTEETPIGDALTAMRSGGIRRLPVVDAEGRLEGLVRLDDVLGLLAEEISTIGHIVEETSPRT